MSCVPKWSVVVQNGMVFKQRVQWRGEENKESQVTIVKLEVCTESSRLLANIASSTFIYVLEYIPWYV